MKRTTLTSCFIFVVALLAAPAFAGPMVMEKNVAPAPPMCDWTGFYVGVNGGVGWQKSGFTDNNGAVYEGYDAPAYGATNTFDNVSYLAGGQVGYNYQWRDLVIGIEADADYSGNSINKAQLYGTYDETGPENWGWYDKASIDFQGSVRGRIGISLLDNKALIYMTGGAAFVHGYWDMYAAYYTSDNSGYYDRNFRGDDWRYGLIGGAGIEYKLNCHWSIKAEGLYTWLAENNLSQTSSGGYFASDHAAKVTFADELYSFRVGLNYNFGNFFGH
jgi:outer membrane immunogenic protein